MKLVQAWLVVTIMTALPLYGQSVKRHPGEHLRYNTTLTGGDIEKISSVAIYLKTNAPAPPNQPGAQGEFGAQCKKSADPKVWACDATIPQNIRDGDYQLYMVNVGTAEFGTAYNEDFHLPVVPIENPTKFIPPSKVTVTEQH